MIKNKEKISVHHVGGRNGSGDFPSVEFFAAEIVNVMYDADKDCTNQIDNVWSTSKSETFVLPYCLSDKKGLSSFNLNYDPYTSSIYPFNLDYSDYYYIKEYEFDYNLGDAAKTMEVINVTTTTLDSVIEEEKEIAPPDFLSLDTQGSELDILIGSKALLEKNILAIQTEVEFHPFYKGQALFGDISAYLYNHGFLLVNLAIFTQKNHIKAPYGFRGDGMPMDGEALFIKKPELLSEYNPKEELMLRKLVFISLCFGQLDIAARCIDKLKNISSSGASNLKWQELVSKLIPAVANLPNRGRMIFSDHYTHQESKLRFTGHNNTEKSKFNYSFSKRALKFLSRKMQIAFQNIYPSIFWFFSVASNDVEKTLIDFKMKVAYKILIKNKLRDKILYRRFN